MPSAISQGGRIRTNISSKLAYDSFKRANSEVANSRLRMTTGLRINSAADDVSGYITSKSLFSRKSSLSVSVRSANEAKNVASIVQDSLDNIHGLISEIRKSATLASSASVGTDEKVALAQSSFDLVQQIDLVQNSTVFSGRQLLDGNFNGEWIVGFSGDFSTQTIGINLTSNNVELSIASQNFSLKILDRESPVQSFAGVTSLDLTQLQNVSSNNLGIFNDSNIDSFINSLGDALTNVSTVASYVGAIENKLNSQIETLNSQVVNYSSAISRIRDSDIAEEQLKISKNQFLQSSSLISLSQANASTIDYFRLLA